MTCATGEKGSVGDERVVWEAGEVVLRTVGSTRAWRRCSGSG